jgi:hypothetical protein
VPVWLCGWRSNGDAKPPLDHRCRPQDDHDGGKDERRWKHFYEQRKINNFASLPASQKMAISLTAHPDPMIDTPHKSRR